MLKHPISSELWDEQKLFFFLKINNEVLENIKLGTNVSNVSSIKFYAMLTFLKFLLNSHSTILKESHNNISCFPQHENKF